jgi:hypothetical protein
MVRGCGREGEFTREAVQNAEKDQKPDAGWGLVSPQKSLSTF